MRSKALAAVAVVVLLASLPTASVAADPQREKLEMYVLEGSADAASPRPPGESSCSTSARRRTGSWPRPC